MVGSSVSVKTFLNSCLNALSKRSLTLAALNTLYFGTIFISVLLTQLLFPAPLEQPLEFPGFFITNWGLPLMALSIFTFNLIVSSFLLTTLPGLAFFALPIAVMVWRAAIWGALLNGLPTPLFLTALPTLVLEGEGYVLASLAGIILGLSWLKPSWTYKNKDLSRLDALKNALKDCLHLYVSVAVLLTVAAIVEAFTILSL